MGWTLSKAYKEPILGHSGLVENYMSNMFILPGSGLGVVILANTNDYLVTNSMFSSISGSIVLMLMGDAPVRAQGLRKSVQVIWDKHLFLKGLQYE